MHFTYTDNSGIQHFHGDDALDQAQRAYAAAGFPRAGTIDRVMEAPTVRAQSALVISENGSVVSAALVGFADEDDAALITYDEHEDGVSWYEASDFAREVWNWTQAQGMGVTYHNGFSIAVHDLVDADDRLALATGTMPPAGDVSDVDGDGYDPTTSDIEVHDTTRTHFGRTDDVVEVRGGGRKLADDEGRVTQTGSANTVSELAAERVARHEVALSKMGIALPPPIYAPGSRVNSWGVDNFRTKREEWAAQPLTSEALLTIAEHVKAERREDVNVPAHTLRMEDDGSLRGPGIGTLTLEESGLKGLLSMLAKDGGFDGHADVIDSSRLVFPRGATLMTEMPPHLRAHVFNTMLNERGNAGQDVMLRTRKYNGDDRSVFAVQSTSYGAFDADQVATAIADALHDSGARGEVIYNPRTTSLRAHAMWAADNVVDFSAGDVFKVGGTFRTNDAGGGSIRGDAGAWRNLCLNLIIIGAGKASVFRVAHKGSMDQVAQEIRAGMDNLKSGFATFLDEWGYLRPNAITDITLWGERFDGVEHALTWGVEHKRITAEVKRNVLLETLLTAHSEEPGNTLADLVNSMTRAAHMDLINDCARDTLERRAGELVPVLARQARRENLKTLNA